MFGLATCRSVQRHRSYARASRRQAATPGIPRPGWVRPEERVRLPTFGVVLDTSGSMDAKLLGKALGAIASYALARGVPAARVVFCDAVAYDAGYLPVEEIVGRVTVRGRGGTVLQPGIDLIERADDFPATGPILVITDGQLRRAADTPRTRVPGARRRRAALPSPRTGLPNALSYVRWTTSAELHGGRRSGTPAGASWAAMTSSSSMAATAGGRGPAGVMAVTRR
jgi:hypothetical protein